MNSPFDPKKLRSRAWFDNPGNPDMTALYIERYLNFGLSQEELQSGKPIIGIAQTGSDLSPCNRHHLELAKRVREGIREAGGIAIEFPVHPIQETGKRPTAALDRNLAYLGLVELLYGYPLDGVVLTIGCDKTTPACLMAAATVNIPAIALSVGPMLNGWFRGERTGSGTIVWKAREMMAAGEIDYKGFVELVASSAPSTGYCNTMGTATTMNSLAEALGMQLPGSAAIPAPYRDRQEMAYRTGLRIVDMVREDLKPSDIMTRESFINAIRVNSAIGGSTNAPIHLNGLARHLGVELSIDDWQKYGEEIPLLVNLQPAGEYLGEDYYHAGGVPAVVSQLMGQGLIHEDAMTVNGRTIGENCRGAGDRRREGDPPLRPADEGAGRLPRAQGQPVLLGDHEDERDLAGVPRPVPRQPGRSGGLRGQRRSSSTGRRTTTGASTIRRSASTRRRCCSCAAPVRSAIRGPRKWSTCARRTTSSRRACIRCRASATGASRGPRAVPRSSTPRPRRRPAAGSPCSRTGDRVRIDLRKCTANILVSDEELEKRRKELEAAGGYSVPGAPDAVAGTAARRRRPDGDRRGARTGRRLPAHRADQGHPARQPLTDDFNRNPGGGEAGGQRRHVAPVEAGRLRPGAAGSRPRPSLSGVSALSARDRAYHELKYRILEGQLAPGTTLLENEVAQLLAMSRTPIREALIRLEEERLVAVRPRRGFTVLEQSIDDLVEIYEVFSTLEVRAARLAAERGVDAGGARPAGQARRRDGAGDGEERHHALVASRRRVPRRHRRAQRQFPPAGDAAFLLGRAVPRAHGDRAAEAAADAVRHGAPGDRQGDPRARPGPRRGAAPAPQGTRRRAGARPAARQDAPERGACGRRSRNFGPGGYMTSSTKEAVGFIGVGLMGHGMAKNIVEKGHPLTVMAHRNRAPVEDLVSRGASEAKSAEGGRGALRHRLPLRHRLAPGRGDRARAGRAEGRG